jgi:hypothetical protein
MPRGRTKGIQPSTKIKVDFLIPITQDSPPKRSHPHTAYAEWNTWLFIKKIDKPTCCGGEDVGSEGWGKSDENSIHWWVVIPKRKLQVLLRLLRDKARRIFDQRWIIAWTGEKVYELGDTVKTKPNRTKSMRSSR